MVSTVRMQDVVKQQLKMQCVKLGVTQMDLVQRYVIEGIQRDNANMESMMTIDDVAKTLLPDSDFEIPDEFQLNPEGVLTGKCDTIEKIEELLEHDNPSGNCLTKITMAVDSDEVIDEVQEKRSTWRG